MRSTGIPADVGSAMTGTRGQGLCVDNSLGYLG